MEWDTPDNTATYRAVIRVGPQRSDFPAADGAGLQRAVDELARLAPQGGGLLLIEAGTYPLLDSLTLRSPLTVRGEGPATVLQKGPAVRSPLRVDADRSEYTIRVADPAGFAPGMGVHLKCDSLRWGWTPSPARIVAVDGDGLRLDRPPEHDYPVEDHAWVESSFPLVAVRQTLGVVLEHLTLDGRRAVNAEIPLDGCRGAALYLHQVRHAVLRHCLCRDFAGDGFSWQTTDHVTVEDCRAENNLGLGFHPGTGSPNTTVRRCTAAGNGGDGLFLCWGVRHGRFEDNLLEDNGGWGISIGHKDTDNLFQRNRIRRNRAGGILFREETRANAGHRCTFRDNLLEANGDGTPAAAWRPHPLVEGTDGPDLFG